jgi:hypothetical protein
MLEMIGRYALHRYEGSCYDYENLKTKIEMTLDFMLPVLGLQRV